jgi:hypothetical protein
MCRGNGSKQCAILAGLHLGEALHKGSQIFGPPGFDLSSPLAMAIVRRPLSL